MHAMNTQEMRHTRRIGCYDFNVTGTGTKSQRNKVKIEHKIRCMVDLFRSFFVFLQKQDCGSQSASSPLLPSLVHKMTYARFMVKACVTRVFPAKRGVSSRDSKVAIAALRPYFSREIRPLSCALVLYAKSQHKRRSLHRSMPCVRSSDVRRLISYIRQ